MVRSGWPLTSLGRGPEGGSGISDHFHQPNPPPCSCSGTSHKSPLPTDQTLHLPASSSSLTWILCSTPSGHIPTSGPLLRLCGHLEYSSHPLAVPRTHLIHPEGPASMPPPPGRLPGLYPSWIPPSSGPPQVTFSRFLALSTLTYNHRQPCPLFPHEAGGSWQGQPC